MRTLLISLLVMFALDAADAFAGGKWEGTGFSADFKQVRGQAVQSGRFFLDSPGMRMEMTEDGDAMVSIMRFKENDLLMLIPDAKMYMTMPQFSQGDGPVGRLEEKFAGACAEYEEREKVGDETIGGRKTEKWRCEHSAEDDPDAVIWFDTRLGVPIRIEDDDGGRFEMSNIQEGDQDASLFQPPADYRAMSMQDMMQMDQ